ncbi:MAG: hypothetical protein JWO42_556 [Chloroflexi bacterium]|jgi:hypothetical protein|nr:hypothetical protein [Chloroflexota bacterium]
MPIRLSTFKRRMSEQRGLPGWDHGAGRQPICRSVAQAIEFLEPQLPAMTVPAVGHGPAATA